MPEPAPKSRLDARRSCNGKVAWGTESDAKDAAKRQAGDFGRPMDFYDCPHCGLWHTGNIPRWLALDREYGVFADPDEGEAN